MQAADGVSLDDQESKLIAETAKRGITDYVVLVDDGKSAKSLQRPKLQEALQLLAAGEYNLLIATKLDRLSRSTSDVLTLAAASESQGWAIAVLDGAVQFDSTTPAGKLTLTMMSALAEFEREQISARVTDAMHFKRERGDKGLITIDIETRIVTMYQSGLSMDKIAKQLNAEDIPSARGGKWAAQTVWRVIERKHAAAAKGA